MPELGAKRGIKQVMKELAMECGLGRGSAVIKERWSLITTGYGLATGGASSDGMGNNEPVSIKENCSAIETKVAYRVENGAFRHE
jgi:hypothetical protein